MIQKINPKPTVAGRVMRNIDNTWNGLGESFTKNRISFGEESHFFLFIIMFRKKALLFELHGELSYGKPNGSPRRAMLALFFLSTDLIAIPTGLPRSMPNADQNSGIEIPMSIDSDQCRSIPINSDQCAWLVNHRSLSP